MSNKYDDILLDDEGNVDWNANGWPVPNEYHDTEVDGYITYGMPDEIFDEWMLECDNLDTGWSVDW